MDGPDERARQWHEQNRQSWNAATRAHNSHKGDQAAFFRDGGTTVFSEELELLGDLAGKSLVHLQCNAGQDTLSLARLGADVLGVDISDEAIEFARALSRDAGIPGRFERADLYDWFAGTREQFDIVYTSYGVIGWLSDLAAWARGIHRVLRPGGRLVVIEYHPVVWMFDQIDDAPDTPAIDRLRVRYPYSGGDVLHWDDGVSDYVARSGDGLTPMGYHTGVEAFKNPHHAFEFVWGLEEIVTAVLDAGLRLTRLRDYPYTTGCKPLPGMKDLGDRRYTMPDGVPRMPLMFGLVAMRPA